MSSAPVERSDRAWLSTGTVVLLTVLGLLCPSTSAMTFQVEPVAGATEYLWGFFQSGAPAWENYANERRLSPTSYSDSGASFLGGLRLACGCRSNR